MLVGHWGLETGLLPPLLSGSGGGGIGGEYKELPVTRRDVFKETPTRTCLKSDRK